MNNYADVDIGGNRAIELLVRCLSWIEEDHCGLGEMLDTLYELGFNDTEIEELGFGYVLDVKEAE